MRCFTTSFGRAAGLLLLLLLGGAGAARAQHSWQWTAQAGGPDWTGPVSMAADPQGNVLVTGHFFGTTAFGATTLTATPSTNPLPFGQSDVFVAKYSASGKLRWVQTGGGPGHDFPTSLATDNEGAVYVTGEFGGTLNVAGGTATFGPVTLTSHGGRQMFLVKYDSTGRVQWARQSDGTSLFDSAIGQDVAVDAHHNVYWTGDYNGYSGTATLAGAATPGTGAGTYLLKLAPDGAVRWLRNVPASSGSTEQGVGRLAVTRRGEVYFGGRLGLAATFGPYSLQNFGSTGSDVFLTKYDSLGTVQWAKKLGGPERDVLSDLVALPNGNALLAVGFRGTASFLTQSLTSRGATDLALACVTGTGGLGWLRQEGADATDEWTAELTTDKHNNAYACCQVGNLSALDAPPVANSGAVYTHLVRYDSVGTRTWTLPGPPTYSASPANYASVSSLAALAPAKLVVTGSFRGTLTLPGLAPISCSVPASTASPGQFNLWLAGLDPTVAVPTTSPGTTTPGTTTGTTPGTTTPGTTTPGTTTGTTPGTTTPGTTTPGTTTPGTTTPGTTAVALFIPNIITPNGDADNECFVVKGLDAARCSLRIYSRWGRQVYYTASYQQDWRAEHLADGLYFYLLQPPGQPPLKGWVEVVR